MKVRAGGFPAISASQPIDSIVINTGPNFSARTLVRASRLSAQNLTNSCLINYPVRMKIEHIALAALQPYEQNSRTHSSEQVEQIAASIQEFGFTNPLLVNESYQIIAGHGRLLAAAVLNMPTVPVVCLPGLSGEQQRALVIADNQLALNAGWDEKVLAEEIRQLEADDFDLELLGFDDSELDRLLADDEEAPSPDVVMEPQPDPVSKTGDVWLLGDIKVSCGESTMYDGVGSLEDVQAAYVDVIIYQWQVVSGKDAILESTGETYNALR